MTDAEQVELAIRVLKEFAPPEAIPNGYWQMPDHQKYEIREQAVKFLKAKLACDEPPKAPKGWTHRADVKCDEFLCLPEKNPSHYVHNG